MNSLYSRVVKPVRRGILVLLAILWRPFLFRTTFIGITGSVGKTTTKECIAAVLSSRFSIAKTFRNHNDLIGVARTILSVRPSHRFAVIEIGTERAGMVQKSAGLVRPHVAIVLSVARTHTNSFRTLNDTAVEKGQLLKALSKRGLAILNAEDPRVKKMASICSCKVKMFGLSKDLDVWADGISSKWPDRLSLRVHSTAATHAIKTNLVGEHWVNAILASVLTAQHFGIPMTDAVAEFARIQPSPARMQPVITPGGAIILRDEGNSSPDTFEAAIKILRQSTARRKVLVFSDLSDSKERPRQRLRAIGHLAPTIGDVAIFVGEHGHYAEKAAISSGMNPDCVRNFPEPSRAAEYLRSELREGDLVLIKGRISHHLARIVLAQWGNIGCWKKNCNKRILCENCEHLKPEFDLQKVSWLLN
jgi:UDP-N-acetylmuramoyl-tripeptide--D-alanyl-D-alanine ligase